MKIYGSTDWQFGERDSIWSRMFATIWDFLTGSPGRSVAVGVEERPVSSSGDSEPDPDSASWPWPPVAPIYRYAPGVRYQSGRTNRQALWFMPDVQFEAVRYIEKTGKEAYVLGYSLVDGREVTHYCFLDGYRTTSEDDAAERLRRTNAELDGALP